MPLFTYVRFSFFGHGEEPESSRLSSPKTERGRKNMALTRKIDDMGRIVLPRDIRDELGWKAEEPIEIEIMDRGEQTVLLRPAKPRCGFCGEPKEELKTLGQGSLCATCLEELTHI